jgi:hypothetical protein
MLQNRAVRGTAFVLFALGYFAFSYLQNGFSRDLTSHLNANGISLSLVGSDAGVGSRRGHVSFRADPAVEAKIIERFGLKPVEPTAAPQITSMLPMGTRALWGIVGRPATLKLKSGVQFEYLYLQKTPDGLTFLAAEYAAG